ncbi:MAG: primosomal protein N' [Gemmatimonadota bacterium]|nr:primosomal protein N' [Gemmatimonadota bacterium]
MIPETCSVALPIPSPQPYVYAVPLGLADRVLPGARVVVPVRSRELVGVVLEVDVAERTELKSVLLAPDPTPLVPTALLELAQWMSRYYAASIGLAFRAMLPSALWGGSRLVASLHDATSAPGGVSRAVVEALERAGGSASSSVLSRRLKRPVWDVLQRLARAGVVTLETQPPRLGPKPKTERILVLRRMLPTLLEREQVFGRATRQREAYEVADSLGGEVSVRHLSSQLRFSPGVVRGLVERGVAVIEDREQPRDPFSDVISEPLASPSRDQAAAVDAIRGIDPGKAITLFGVTGSGKTLVYLEALRDAVRAEQGVIVLVPEIALTPQTVSRVRGAFGDTVAVLHSGLSDGERVDAWRALASGAKRVAVGARSAVFAPIPRLAAIVVDEEHDASYKHGESPRYHTRDVALRRGRIEGARVILGSATPALETWAKRDRIPVVGLPNRVSARPLPEVALIDMRSEARVREARIVPWSQALDAAVDEALRAGDQVMLLLNRRGFAHFLQCPDCGHVWECPACSISLTVHRAPAGLRCHYCGYDTPLPHSCPECGATAHRTRGVGTQTLERWLAERFSSARLARMDADTTSGKWSHRRILEAVGRRDVDVLFGTQMIAKGLDFPGITLVGVVDADTGLHLPDFRAAERTFQLIAQVAGRAGRGPRGGKVLVQTRTPSHFALQAAARHDFEQFAERELASRQSPPYPPHVALVNVLVSSNQETVTANAAIDVGDWVRGLIEARAPGSIDVIGPAPAPLARIQRRWRWHLLLRGHDAAQLGQVMRYAAQRAPHTGRGPVRVVFDRDPVSLL